MELVAPCHFPVLNPVLPYPTPTRIQTHLLRAEDHFVFSSSPGQFVSIDKIYGQKKYNPESCGPCARWEARKQLSSTHGVAKSSVYFLMKGPLWPRPLDLAHPFPGLSDRMYHGILTGNVSHILDAGSDQETQSMGEKGEKTQWRKIMRLVTAPKEKLKQRQLFHRLLLLTGL